MATVSGARLHEERPQRERSSSPASLPEERLQLEPHTYIDPATGEIDYTRSSWSRSSWSEAGELLRSSWSRSSWSLAPETVANYAAAAADPTRSS